MSASSSKENPQACDDRAYPEDNTQDNIRGSHPYPLTTESIMGYDASVTVSRKETIRELKKELAAVNRKATQIAAAIRALEVLEGAVAGDGENGKVKPLTAGQSYPTATLAILEKAPRPLSVRQILDTFEKNNYPIATTKPYRTIYKVLKSHPDMFVNVRGKWRVTLEGK